MKRPFYIGYIEKAPKPIARFLKRVVPMIILLLLIIGGLIATTQTGFNDGKFELGKLTQMTGFVETYPIPMLRIEKPNSTGFESILLIGFGKFGADSTLAEMERHHGISFKNHRVTLEGTQIYMDDMRILELTEKKFSLIKWEQVADVQKLSKNFVGVKQLSGEVIDPKCYFGVMKPGEGKTHRSCAVRCISGGIPPMLKISESSDENPYVFILGENETPQQSRWAPVAGLKHTIIHGNEYNWNGWRVMIVP